MSTVSLPSYHNELLPHRDLMLYPNRRRPEGNPPHPTIVLISTSFYSGVQLVHSVAVSILSHHQLHKLILQLGIPIRDREKTSFALSSRRHPLWSALRRGPCGCDRDSRAWICTSSHRHLEKLSPNTIVAATSGLVLTHDGNVPQELHQLATQTPLIP